MGGDVDVGDAAAAPSDGRVDAFHVSSSFVVDTGCGRDLVSQRDADGFSHLLRDTQTYQFSTANGISEASQVLPVRAVPFEGSADLLVLPSTPAVLSVGARCRKGYSFIWLAGKAPCMVTPSHTMYLWTYEATYPIFA